jgi:hypothetical protein
MFAFHSSYIFCCCRREYGASSALNQLKMNTVEKLVYIHLNAALLDEIDNKD